MKKSLFLLTSLLLGAATVMGQNVRPLNALTPAVTGKMSSVEKVKANPALLSKAKSVDFATRSVSPRADVQAMYMHPEGMLHSGITPEIKFFAIPSYVFPSFTNMEFKNYSTEGATYNWTLGDSELSDLFGPTSDAYEVKADGSLDLSFPLFLNGFYKFIPMITATSGGQSDKYFYGNWAKDPDGKLYEFGIISAGAGFNWIGNADWAVGGLAARLDEKHYFGTGYTEGGKVTTGVLSVITPTAPLYIKEMGAMLTKYDDSKPLMPDNGTLNMTLYKINDKGQITDEVIAKAEATMGDEIVETAEEGIYFATFNLVVEDDLGLDSPANLTATERFAAEITGFDKEGYNLTFPVAFDGLGLGTSYTVHGDDLNYFSYKDLGVNDNEQANSSNIYIQMNASYVHFEKMNPNVEAIIPVTGGYGVTAVEDGESYNDISILSNFPLEDEDGNVNVWFEESEIPSWLTVELSGEYYTDEQPIVAAFVKAEASSESRATWVNIYTYGTKVSFPVAQGASSISSDEAIAVKAVAQGDNIVLTYTNDVKSVDLMNAAGQLIGSYELNGNGSYTIPAANLVKGMYIVKFNGSQNAAVKVMK